MKALMKVADGPGNLELRDIPEPAPGPGQVKVRVAATGICGSDLHIQDGEYKVVPPVVIGHETAGTVVAVGDGVGGYRPGDRVTAQTTISTCGRCAFCQTGRTNLCPERRWLGGHVNGGFAAYVVVPERNLLRLPDHVSDAAAALIEPLACCVHGVLEVAGPATSGAGSSAARGGPGATVVVSGPGPIGLLCAQVARAAGADVIVLGTAADGARFALARRLGFRHLVDVQAQDPIAAVRDLTSGRGPDLVVECAGAVGSLDQCLRLATSGAAGAAPLGAGGGPGMLAPAPRGGTVLQIGLYGRPVPMAVDTLVVREIRLLGSFSSTPTAWPVALDLIATGRVATEPLVTSRRPLTEWADAFRAARRKSEGKILLTPAE